ncbi:MAG: terminase family protein, partial [Acetobacter orientalis]
MKNLQPLHRQASQTAQNELATRKQARTSLLGFTHYTMPDYRCGPHHALLCQKLEAVAQGHITRLMVFMPPRHGKSELVSRRFPAWYLGQHPTRQVIAASYGATLAQDFGRSVRNLVTTQPFQALFPGVKLAPDSAAKDVWHTAQGGSYTAAGVGGGLTGKGAHLAIIDDPIKDRQEAESPARRLAVWAWYRAVLRTRLMPGGAIVLVMTRWSPDDLAGRLLADMQNATGEAWHTLSLPAVAEAPPSPQPSP